MPFSTTPPVPSNGGLGFQYSLYEGWGVPLSVNFTPKNPDGTPFDCTALAGLTGNFDNGERLPIKPTVTLRMTSATGGNYATSGRYSITANDGVTFYTVAAGTWSLSYIA